MNPNLEKLWANADKILLTILIIISILLHQHMLSAAGGTIDPAEDRQITWMEQIIGQLIAALLTLTVAQRRLVNGDKPPEKSNGP